MGEFLSFLGVALVTGGFTMLGVLATGEQQRKRQAEVFKEQAQARQRTLIVRLSAGVHQWLELEDVFVVARSKMSKQDTLDSTKTDMSDRLIQARREARVALSEARIELTDPDMRDQARNIWEKLEDFPDQVATPLREARDGAVKDGWEYLDSVRAMLKELESYAVARLHDHTA